MTSVEWYETENVEDQKLGAKKKTITNRLSIFFNILFF